MFVVCSVCVHSVNCEWARESQVCILVSRVAAINNTCRCGRVYARQNYIFKVAVWSDLLKRSEWKANGPVPAIYKYTRAWSQPATTCGRGVASWRWTHVSAAPDVLAPVSAYQDASPCLTSNCDTCTANQKLILHITIIVST